MRGINIPLVDLSAQFESIGSEVKARVEAVLQSQRFILGPEVAALEAAVAGLCEAPFAAGVASGTDALLLSLKAMGVGPGHEVITTPFTFYATASTIVHAGARPVFADIDPDTCLISPKAVEAAVTEKTKAIVPVHLFGQCADMEAIARIAEKHGLAVLEDACQAVGAKQSGRPACSMGDAAALSFYPSKNLGACGDAGMIVTLREDLFESVRMLRVHGAESPYRHKHIGFNSRLDEVQAAVLLAKLPYVDEWNRKRREHAAGYDRRFRDSEVEPLSTLPGNAHVYNNYVVRVRDRQGLMSHLRERGIGCGVYYPEPLHRMECFAAYVDPGLSLPASEKASQECLAIPVYPEMTDEMVDFVAEGVLGFFHA